MNAFQALTRQLALQADRKILKTEEAGYLRLDLSAHEKATTLLEEWRRESAWGRTKQFVRVALGLYLLLFLLTNAQAYGQIALANLQEDWKSYEASRPIELALSLSNDPWTGERVAEHVEPEKPLAVLSFAEDPLAQLSLSLGVPTSYENRIVIKRLNINAPIVEPELGLSALEKKDWTVLEEQIQDTLLKGVVHYPGTALPGSQGNSLLTGHSSNVFWEKSEFNTVFALLPKIQVGDEIEITQNQTVYRYVVTEKKEVSPKDVSVFRQTEESTLTLVTCTPVGTTLKRLIVTATLVEAD